MHVHTCTHTPLFFFSFPVKAILLFDPTGSKRGRLEREWAASRLLLLLLPPPPLPIPLTSLPLPPSPPPPPPPPPTVTEPCLEKKRGEGRGVQRGERKTTTANEETHRFHTSFQQEKAAAIRESPDGLNIPGAERPRLKRVNEEGR